MASVGYITSLLSGLDADVRKRLKSIFEYALAFLSWGPVEDATASVNFSGSFYQFTTSSVANQEFSIVHQQGAAPYLAIPVLPLNVGGAQLVSLSLSTRVADATRVYLTSASTSVTGFLYLEGA